MPFRFRPLALQEVILVEADARADARGFFIETYKRSAFEAGGIPGPFVQDNQSRSTRGVLRGMHWQNPPKAQGKLVGVSRGEIFDVAVDIRAGSPTFGAWVAEVLSDENRKLLWVPPGFAHGFVALSEAADVVYKVTAEYSQELDRGFVWSDEDVGIRWPVSVPILSQKDAGLPRLRNSDNRFSFRGPL